MKSVGSRFCYWKDAATTTYDVSGFLSFEWFTSYTKRQKKWNVHSCSKIITHFAAFNSVDPIISVFSFFFLWCKIAPAKQYEFSVVLLACIRCDSIHGCSISCVEWNSWWAHKSSEQHSSALPQCSGHLSRLCESDAESASIRRLPKRSAVGHFLAFFFLFKETEFVEKLRPDKGNSV